MTTDKIEAGFAAFLVAAQEYWDRRTREVHKGTRPFYKIGYTTGRKYHRVFKARASTRDVVAFVDMTTGDIYAAASWKQRAAGVRGNVLDDGGRGFFPEIRR